MSFFECLHPASVRFLFRPHGLSTKLHRMQLLRSGVVCDTVSHSFSLWVIAGPGRVVTIHHKIRRLFSNAFNKKARRSKLDTSGPRSTGIVQYIKALWVSLVGNVLHLPLLPSHDCRRCGLTPREARLPPRHSKFFSEPAWCIYRTARSIVLSSHVWGSGRLSALSRPLFASDRDRPVVAPQPCARGPPESPRRISLHVLSTLLIG